MTFSNLFPVLFLIVFFSSCTTDSQEIFPDTPEEQGEYLVISKSELQIESLADLNEAETLILLESIIKKYSRIGLDNKKKGASAKVYCADYLAVALVEDRRDLYINFTPMYSYFTGSYSASVTYPKVVNSVNWIVSAAYIVSTEGCLNYTNWNLHEYIDILQEFGSYVSCPGGQVEASAIATYYPVLGFADLSAQITCN